jgi:hypothetical protein
MNLKMLIALLSAGIAVLLGSTAVVATFPVGSTGKATEPVANASPPTSSSASSPPRPLNRVTSGGSGEVTSPAPTSSTAAPNTTSTAPTERSTPQSTAFVLVTITYAVKTGDTIASIAKWFDQHGYSVQFGANLQVIESNENLIVPGALISISNGVMTIHSPV